MFARDAPAWAIPLPVGDEICPLLRSTSGPICLLGHYACSLMMMSYDYSAHPSLSVFGCGVMAHPSAPDHVRDDPELQAEFPAKELPGLCGRLVWFGESLPVRVRAELLRSLRKPPEQLLLRFTATTCRFVFQTLHNAVFQRVSEIKALDPCRNAIFYKIVEVGTRCIGGVSDHAPHRISHIVANCVKQLLLAHCR